MTAPRMQVLFCETLTPGQYLCARLTGRKTFHCGESFGMRIIRHLLRLRTEPLVERIRYGHVEHATGIRRRAYEQALEQIAHKRLPLASFDPGFGADMDLLASKFLLDHLFARYEFQGMAAAYAADHPELNVALVCDVDLYPTLKGLPSTLRTSGRRQLPWLHYLTGLVLAPLYLRQMMHKSRVAEQEQALQASLICEVDCMPIAAMFQDLFTPEFAPAFFAQRHYLDSFTTDQVQQLGLRAHGVGPAQRQRLVELLRRWLRFALLHMRQCASGGSLLFDFFKALVQGVTITPHASGCTYLTFEHMSTIKAVRNELLRATGNVSVFVPYNTYAIDHYFAPEYRYNYDVLCSPCELLERAYQRQRATTGAILRTGAYSPHRQVADDQQAGERQARLASFKDGNVAVTILSAGVGVETASGERRLATLASQLASHQGVKVFIRQKPTTPDPRFASLYPEALGGHPDVLLTHAEYKLFDFLPMTDLFITSISSSAVDLCGAGGEFYSVDFWQDGDLYFWQTDVPGVFLPPEDACDTIMAWIADKPAGNATGTRAAHRARMNRLRQLIAYEAGSFGAYRARLLAQLEPWLPRPVRKAARSTSAERVTP